VIETDIHWIALADLHVRQIAELKNRIRELEAELQRLSGLRRKPKQPNPNKKTLALG
jgi:uncharacterized small protein (DUF1192 family)